MISLEGPGPSLQGARVRSEVAVAPSTRTRAAPRARSALRSRTRCNWGRTGSSAGTPGRSTGGRTPTGPPAAEPPGESQQSDRLPQSDPSQQLVESREAVPSSSATVLRRALGPGADQPPQRAVEVITQGRATRAGRRGQRAHDHQRSGRKVRQPGPHQMPQPALHPVPDDGPADRPTDHESHFWTAHRRQGIVGAGTGQVYDQGAASRPTALPHPRREVVAAGQSAGSGQQREISGRRKSGRQLDATLAAPRRHDRAPGAGTHAQPEPVGPRAATVIRLERTLALAHGCRSPGAVVRVAMGEGAQECPPVGGRRARA